MMDSIIASSSPYHILLVEDDPIIQRVHSAYLLKMGYEVDTAASGEHAIAKYSENYDLIILDAHLPLLDGFSVAKYIREQEAANQQWAMPLILLSAYPQEYLAQACSQAGINAFATKPISFEHLRIMVCEQLLHNFPADNILDKSQRSYQS